MKQIDVQGAAALLAAAENILIVTHIRPDGDTAGSACALCLGLRSLGKTAWICENHASMKRYDKYLEPYFPPEGFRPGFVTAVDIAGAGQFPPGWVNLAEGCNLAIDHHGTNSGYAAYTLLDDRSAAAGELVLLVLKELGAAITADMAEALYAALSTDTNCFRTAGTTGRTLRMAGELRDTGFDAFSLTKALFETKTAARLRLESYLYGTMAFPDPDICVMTLPYSVIEELRVAEDDMDKLSLLTMAVEGTKTGLLLRQLADGAWKVSLRTDGSIHAGQVLRAVGGGGHPDAAGTVLTGDPEAITEEILRILHEKDNKNKEVHP